MAFECFTAFDLAGRGLLKRLAAPLCVFSLGINSCCRF